MTPWLTASGEQASKYWSKYRLVLVTNTRDFVLLGEDSAGNPTKLETFRLAGSVQEFESRLENPALSLVKLESPWENTFAGLRPTQRQLSTPRTWHGFSPPTPGMA